MVIARYPGDYTLKYFERLAPGGTDLACVFAPDGRLVMWLEPEIAVEMNWRKVEEAIVTLVMRDRILRGEIK